MTNVAMFVCWWQLISSGCSLCALWRYEGAGSRLRKGGMLLFYCVYLTALYLLQISYQSSFIFLQSISTHIFSNTFLFGSKSTYRSETASFVRTTDRREVVAVALYNGWFSRGDEPRAKSSAIRCRFVQTEYSWLRAMTKQYSYTIQKSQRKSSGRFCVCLWVFICRLPDLTHVLRSGLELRCEVAA